MSYFKSFILIVTTMFPVIHLYSDFVEITDQIGPRQRDVSGSFIALNNDPYNQVIVLYDNLHQATLFKFNSENCTMSNITSSCGINTQDLNDIQAISFVNDRLMAICYGDSKKSAKLYFLQENGLFSDMTVDSGIPPVDLEKAQSLIYFDSTINRNILSVFICYSSASGKLPKFLEYDRDNNYFAVICEIEFSFLRGFKSIDCGNNQLIVTYLKLPARLFTFCEGDKSFIDVSATCQIEAKDLQHVRSIVFSNGQLVLVYSASGIGRRRSIYDLQIPVDYQNNLKSNKAAKLYQINPDDIDGFYISSDYNFVNDRALYGVTCIKFMKALEGVIALISYASGNLRIFHDPEALFYEKKSNIKSAYSIV